MKRIILLLIIFMIAVSFAAVPTFSQENSNIDDQTAYASIVSSPDENVTDGNVPDATSDRRSLNVTDETFVPQDKQSKYKIYGMGGGFISASGRIMLGDENKYAEMNSDNLPMLHPVDGYSIALETKLWLALLFKEESMLRAGGSVRFSYNDGKLFPIFHIDELYFKWRYPMGDIIIGRNICSTFDPILFGGLLDGIQLNLNVPFLNFRSFMGYTGFLGLFHPYNNTYSISQYDRTYHEDSNLALLEPKYDFLFNAEQAMRFFFCTDFDV